MCPGGKWGGGEWQRGRGTNFKGSRALRLTGQIQAQGVGQVPERSCSLCGRDQCSSLLQQTQADCFSYRLSGLECGSRGPSGAQRRELRVHAVPHQPGAANVQARYFGRGPDLCKRWACFPWLLLLEHITRSGGERGRGSPRDGQRGRRSSSRGRAGVHGLLVCDRR